MSKGTILAHKHTLCEAFTGFFRALATERFSAVRDWLHPELEQLVRKQCERLGEVAFLRNLRHGLGSATQRVRLGASKAEGARQIRTELLSPTGAPAGTVVFVLSPDGWRIYSVEVWTNSSAASQQRRQPQATQIARTQSIPVSEPMKTKKRSKLPKMLPQKWLKTIYASR
jgi:quinol monooxygenase YgiN